MVLHGRLCGRVGSCRDLNLNPFINVKGFFILQSTLPYDITPGKF
jgi:hypothetical protein